MTTMTNKKIGIIGGGPGGLMLGLLLQNQGLDVHIYEKADRNVNRSRGGSLDIHHDTGQLPFNSHWPKQVYLMSLKH